LEQEVLLILCTIDFLPRDWLPGPLTITVSSVLDLFFVVFPHFFVFDAVQWIKLAISQLLSMHSTILVMYQTGCAWDLFVRDLDQTRDVKNVRDRDVGNCVRDETLWVRDETETETFGEKQYKQSSQVAAYRDNWSGIMANHVAFIIWAFYGLVNTVVGLPYVILVSVVY